MRAPVSTPKSSDPAGSLQIANVSVPAIGDTLGCDRRPAGRAEVLCCTSGGCDAEGLKSRAEGALAGLQSALPSGMIRTWGIGLRT